MSKEYVMQLEATIANLRRDNQMLKERLESLGNSNPSEALEILYDNAKLDRDRIEEGGIVTYAEEIEHNETIKPYYDTIKTSLIKAQEMEKVIKELCEYYGMDHLYPYDNLDAIETTFKNRLDDSEADRLAMLDKMNRLSETNKDLTTKRKSSREYKVYEPDENGSHILCYCEESGMADVICKALALADPKGDPYFYSPVLVAGTLVPGGGGYTGYRKLPDGKLDKLILG